MSKEREIPEELVSKIGNPHEKFNGGREVSYQRGDKHVASAVFFSQYAYDQEKDAVDRLSAEVPEGFELLLMTDHVQDTNEASLRCVVFVNNETKEVICATAGTRPGLNRAGAHDLRDDALLVFEKNPHKLRPAGVLNDMLLDSLGPKAADYKFKFIGHSLGGLVAQWQTADMDIKLRARNLKMKSVDQVSSVVFECPGTKKIIENRYEEAGLAKEEASKLNLYVFNNRDNLINRLNPQIGKVYTIEPNAQAERKLSAVQIMVEYVAELLGERVHPLLRKVNLVFALGGVTDNLVQEHSLANFHDVFVKQEGTVVMPLEQAVSGIEPLQFDQEIYDEVKDLQQKNGAIGKPKYSMTAGEGKGFPEMLRVLISSIEFQTVMQGIAAAAVSGVGGPVAGAVAGRIAGAVVSAAARRVEPTAGKTAGLLAKTIANDRIKDKDIMGAVGSVAGRVAGETVESVVSSIAGPGASKAAGLIARKLTNRLARSAADKAGVTDAFSMKLRTAAEVFAAIMKKQRGPLVRGGGGR